MDFKCKICTQLFEKKTEVLDHFKIKHNLKGKEHEFPCIVNNSCEKQYLTIHGLKGHVKKCLSNKKLLPPEPIILPDVIQADIHSHDFICDSIDTDVIFLKYI